MAFCDILNMKFISDGKEENVITKRAPAGQ